MARAMTDPTDAHRAEAVKLWIRLRQAADRHDAARIIAAALAAAEARGRGTQTLLVQEVRASVDRYKNAASVFEDKGLPMIASMYRTFQASAEAKLRGERL